MHILQILCIARNHKVTDQPEAIRQWRALLAARHSVEIWNYFNYALKELTRYAYTDALIVLAWVYKSGWSAYIDETHVTSRRMKTIVSLFNNGRPAQLVVKGISIEFRFRKV